MTNVINIYGGPGAGKSTAAAGLFYEMKKLGYEVELVTEYAKEWAWEERDIKPADQIIITGEQLRRESRLYGKVDWIITDSPLYIGAMYQEFYTSEISIRRLLHQLLPDVDKENNINRFNYLILRTKPYNPKGRYESEETANKVDNFLKDFMKSCSIEFKTVQCNPHFKIVQGILYDLQL